MRSRSSSAGDCLGLAAPSSDGLYSLVDAAFIDSLGFAPDHFQLKSFEAIDEGRHVVVAAPTGAGKTLVASYAVHRAISRGDRVFYTTPIKALSNQKFTELATTYGADKVGLLTGDNNINPRASVVVMTTEVLRNMLYGGDGLPGLATVVLDEVHYLQDSYRGPVWEEVIIHLPRHIALVCLSATVSNADELAEWIQTVRGETALVTESTRPVELEHHFMAGERKSAKINFVPVLRGGKANQAGFRFDLEKNNRHKGRGNRHAGRREPAKYRTPNRSDVIATLTQRGLLPAIYFIFSRKACDEAAKSVYDSGLVLTTSGEQNEIRRIADAHVGDMDSRDLEVLGYETFLRQLTAGIAAHHAGMVPPLKEAVESCFAKGLVRVVFATETLALGVNMPARTVVIEKLTKFTGETHEFLTPAQFTQITGRAGRRGIDIKGDAVVLWSPFVSFKQVAELVSSTEYRLTSAFRPTYNMAANLVRRYDPERARQLLNLSFAQFRADADVVRSEFQVERLQERRNKVANQITADFGPVEELLAALATETTVQTDRHDISFALSQLRPGEVIDPKGSELPSNLVVLSVAYRKGKTVRVRCVDADTTILELTADDFDAMPEVTGKVDMPGPYLPNSMSFAFEVAEALKKTRLLSAKRRKKLGPTTIIATADDVSPRARKSLKRLQAVDEEILATRSLVNSRAENLGLQFDRVTDLLEERGHMDGWALTHSGQRLARLYNECDLLAVEAMEEGLFDGLDSGEVAALASVLTYEQRRSGPEPRRWFPSDRLRKRYEAMVRIHNNLARAERRHRLPETKAPDPGFIPMAHAWAMGGDLDDVLAGEEMTAGDFVRCSKQLIDILRQIAMLAPVPGTQDAARQASSIMFRDLLASSSVVTVPDEDDDL